MPSYFNRTNESIIQRLDFSSHPHPSPRRENWGRISSFSSEGRGSGAERRRAPKTCEGGLGKPFPFLLLPLKGGENYGQINDFLHRRLDRPLGYHDNLVGYRRQARGLGRRIPPPLKPCDPLDRQKEIGVLPPSRTKKKGGKQHGFSTLGACPHPFDVLSTLGCQSGQ